MTPTTPGRFSTPAAGPAKAGSITAALAAALLMTTAGAAMAGSGVTIEQPWMRLIIKARPAAGYFTARNATDAPVALTGAASPACGMLMMHRSVEVNGVGKMLPVKSVTVPAHGSLRFAPGGYHLMCMQPKAGMQVGKEVPVTLTFGNGEQAIVAFPVKGAGGK